MNISPINQMKIQIDVFSYKQAVLQWKKVSRTLFYLRKIATWKVLTERNNVKLCCPLITACSAKFSR